MPCTKCAYVEIQKTFSAELKYHEICVIVFIIARVSSNSKLSCKVIMTWTNEKKKKENYIVV